MQKFVIAGLQRTGTTMIVRTLNLHENIVCYGEMFDKEYPNKMPWTYQEWYRHTLLRRAQNILGRPFGIRKYLDEIYTAPEYLFKNQQKRQACTAIGFKFMHNQARANPSVLRYIKANQLPVLLLARKNYLRVLVSRNVNKVFKIGHTAERIKTPQIKLDTKNLLNSLENIESVNAEWEKQVSSNACLKVYYEDFVVDRPNQINRITDFLRVPPNPNLVPPTIKLNPDRLEDVVLNYEEVAKMVAPSRFAYLLTE